LTDAAHLCLTSKSLKCTERYGIKTHVTVSNCVLRPLVFVTYKHCEKVRTHVCRVVPAQPLPHHSPETCNQWRHAQTS